MRGYNHTLDVVRGRSDDADGIAEVVRFYREDLPVIRRQLLLRPALVFAALIAATGGELIWTVCTFGLV